MTRPPSIIAFERLYLGSIALGIVNAFVFWSVNSAGIGAMPQIQATPALAGAVDIMLGASLAINVGITLLFWWLVARARSVVGKWLVVGTEAIGVLLAILPFLRLVRGTAASAPQTAITLLSTALAVAAAVMLFRRDADAWFATDNAEDQAK